jgi:hydrogenase nickel incorporation protein HypA/HybF
MHEYALMERVLETLLAELKRQGVGAAEEVRELSLRVGALDLHSPESFEQAFQVLARGTLLERAKLNLQVAPARLECRKCGGKHTLEAGLDHHDPLPCAPCPSCGAVNVLLDGRGVSDINVTLEKPSN